MTKHVAQILLYDDEKKILLQHRTSDAPTYPNQYGFFGGKIEKGENPEVAVKRECYEELEYILVNPVLVLHITYDCKYGKRIKEVFIEKYNPTKKLVLHEGQGMKWVSSRDLNELDIIDHDLEVLKKIFSKI